MTEEEKRWVEQSVRIDGKPGVESAASETAKTLDAAASDVLVRASAVYESGGMALLERSARALSETVTGMMQSLLKAHPPFRKYAVGAFLTLVSMLVVMAEDSAGVIFRATCSEFAIMSPSGRIDLMKDEAAQRQMIRLMFNRALSAHRLAMDDMAREQAEATSRSAEQIANAALAAAKVRA